MKKFPVILAIFLLLSAGFWYDHHTLKAQVQALQTKLSNQTNQRETLLDCITTSKNSYDVYLNSYFENTGTALYPNYKIDKDTRDWLEKKLQSDLDFCNQEFSASNW